MIGKSECMIADRFKLRFLFKRQADVALSRVRSTGSGLAFHRCLVTEHERESGGNCLIIVRQRTIRGNQPYGRPQ